LVQATLGHASVATTGKYLHAPDDSSARYWGFNPGVT
jgi:site-specific recombinase XerD